MEKEGGSLFSRFSDKIFRHGVKTAPEAKIDDLTSLRARYSDLKAIASLEGSLTGKPSKSALADVKEIESKLVEAVPDSFLQGFLKIYSANGFDMEEIFKAQDEGDWVKPVREVADGLANLASGRRTGVEMSVTGREVFLWLIGFSRGGEEPDKEPVVRAVEGFSKAMEEGIFCGKSLVELNIDKNKAKEIGTFVIVPLIFNHESSKQFKLFTEVVSEIPEGMEWVASLFN